MVACGKAPATETHDLRGVPEEHTDFKRFLPSPVPLPRPRRGHTAMLHVTPGRIRRTSTDSRASTSTWKTDAIRGDLEGDEYAECRERAVGRSSIRE